MSELLAALRLHGALLPREVRALGVDPNEELFAFETPFGTLHYPKDPRPQGLRLRTASAALNAAYMRLYLGDVPAEQAAHLGVLPRRLAHWVRRGDHFVAGRLHGGGPGPRAIKEAAAELRSQLGAHQRLRLVGPEPSRRATVPPCCEIEQFTLAQARERNEES